MLKRIFTTSLIAVLISAILFTTSSFINYSEVNEVFNLQHDYSSIQIPTIYPQSTPSSSGLPDVAPLAPSASPNPKVLKPIQNNKIYNPLISQIKSYLSTQVGTYGVYFVSLTDGLRFGINENKNFIAASTIKVPVSLYLYNRAASKSIKLDTMFEYLDSDYEEGTGDIQYDSFGTEYSLRDLSKKSIEISDNVAVNMLIRFLDFENVHVFMDKIVKHTVSREVNETSPKDMAIYLKTILDLSQKNKLYQELLGYLSNTAYNDRLPLYLPENITVAHKIGTQVQAVHDVGIIFAPKPYILCVLSEEVDEAVAPEVIATLSKMVFDFTQN